MFRVVKVVSLSSVLCLVVFTGCFRPPADRAQAFDPHTARAHLRLSATEMVMAIKEGNADRMVDRMPQPLLAGGDREKARRAMLAMADDLNRVGLSLAAIRLLDTSELVLRGNDVYAIQPYEGELVGLQVNSGTLYGYLVCISIDRGENWAFLDGTGLRSDREKLKQFLPRFPDELELPPYKPPRLDRK